MTRRAFFGATAAGAASFALPGRARSTYARERSSATRPNIVFILADDFGIDGVSAYGGPYPTPAIDDLSKRGMRFEWAYCTPVCGPSRAQLMTGQYPFRNGGIDIDGTMNRATPPRTPSLPALLKSVGYATGMAGKWGQLKKSPGEWGVDRWMTAKGFQNMYWRTSWKENDVEITRDSEIYFPDEMVAYTRRFIREYRNQPFFFYYAMKTPHVPIQRTPDTAPGVTDKAQLYADNVAYVDKQVRLIMEELDAQGLRENTVVFFSGDNGSVYSRATINGRRILGGKVQMNNGGAHVPLIASWPAAIPASQTCSDLVDFTDMLPTLAQIAGFDLPGGHVLDGRSFLPQLKGQPGNPRDWVFVQMGHYYFVRNRNWQLNESGVLFDLKGLPYEAPPVPPDDVSPEVARACRELQAVLDRFNPPGGETWDQWRGFGNRGPGKKPPRGAGSYEELVGAR
jgi:arylsulfatase A